MSKIKFKPVRGAESKIMDMPYVDGMLYFATDTGRMYLDAEERNKIPMGGIASQENSGIFYGTREMPEEEEEEIIFILESDIEGDILPNIDDLILNEPDGCFYRVLSQNADKSAVSVKKLTVAGNGSGGDDGPHLNKKISVTVSNEEGISTLINGQNAYAKIQVFSAIDSDGSILDEENQLWVTVTLQVKAPDSNNYTTYFTKTFYDLDDGESFLFNFGANAKESSTSRLIVVAEGANSGVSAEKQMAAFTMSALELTPTQTFTNKNYFNSSSVNISVNALGEMNRMLDFYWDNELIHSVELSSTDTGRNITCEVQKYTDGTSHGYHLVRVELHQFVNDERKIGVEPLEFEVGVYDGESDPIIWLDKYESVYYDYADVEISYYIYNPSSTSYTVTLYKDNIKNLEHPFENVSTTVADSFEIVDGDEDMQNFYTIACDTVSRDIFFNITKDPDRDMIIQEPLYLDYSFTAKGRSNNESETNRKLWSNNGVKGSFTGFNWYNNGWVKTDEGTALRISNGASFTVPIGPMIFSGSSRENQSHTFEFQFKIRNVQSYDNLISNITRYKNDGDYYAAFVDPETGEYKTAYTNYDAFLQWYASTHGLDYDVITKDYDHTEKNINLNAIACGYYSGDGKNVIGFGLGPQDAFFSNGTNTVSASYVEEKLVNLSIVYSNTDKLISIFVNGVLTGVISSTVQGSFTINSNAIVFNSALCDIDLYKFRVYHTDLTINEVVTNYAVDLKDVVVYDQNTLVNANDKTLFDFEAMIKYNENHPADPIMPYIVFDTSKSNNGDRLSWSKKTKPSISVEFVNTTLDRAYTSGELDELAEKDGVSVEEYYIHHCPSWKGDNISMAVQGTSSEFYPRRNYKLKTKDSNKVVHMTMHKGPFALENKDTKWFYMDNYSVGTTKFTMKIDFMESSGSYNRGLANLLGNAYTHHPLYYYNKENAFTKKVGSYEVYTGEFDENKKYYYLNHKANPKEFSNMTAEIFAGGPINAGIADSKVMGATDTYTVAYAASNAEGDNGKFAKDEYVNKWFIGSVAYEKQDVTKLIDLDDLRTNVQGFPVLAFHKKSDGTYTYIGRYNMLTDKGSDETFGFKLGDAYMKFVDNKPVEEAIECWEFENNTRGFCSFRDPLNRKHLSFNTGIYLGGVDEEGNQTGSKISTAPGVVDDFEYRYNINADVIDIIVGADATRMDSLTTTQKETIKKATGVEINSNEIGQNLVYDWYSNWEKAVQWVWSTALDADFVKKEAEIAAMSEEDKKNYLIEEFVKVRADAEFDEAKRYHTYERHLYIPYKGGSDGFEAAKTAGNLFELTNPKKTYSGKEYIYDSYEYRYDKFHEELEDHFNLDYLATYFVVTEALELYDSRGKNCMMASWGPMKEGGDYIWFPVFYDMDTQLGINNTGIPSFDFSIDATEEGTFSTNDSVLWNNFYLIFFNQIVQKYCQLRGQTEGIGDFTKLDYAPFTTVERIERWYESDPKECSSIVMRGQRPLSAINLDEYYKYIAITSQRGGGYLGQSGEIIYDNTSTSVGDGTAKGSYYYALQGDRSLSRTQFLTNRFNYLDSWLSTGIYSKSGGAENAFWGRLTANNTVEPDITSDKWIATESEPYFKEDGSKRHELDSEYWLTLTPARKSYLSIISDDTQYTGKYINKPVKLVVEKLENPIQTSPNYKEQLIYIYGTETMKSFGDLYKLYLTELHTVDSNNLTDLNLGWDGAIIEDGRELTWYNHNTNTYGLSSMPLLKEFNFSNIQYANANEAVLDLRRSEKLENFRATGSNLQQVQFAEGVALNTLYLPTTLTSLELTEARQLKNIVTEYHRPEEDKLTGKLKADEGLYIENFTDKLDTPTEIVTNLLKLSMINANSLGYDAYRVLNGLYKAKYSSANEIKIAMTNVDWSPYKLIDEGTEYDSSKKYFLDNFHYGLEEFSYNPDNDYETDVMGNKINIGQHWKNHIKNGVLYVLDESALSDAAIIKDITMLDDFVTKQNFISTVDGERIPNITGIIYINNDESLTLASGTKVDEFYVRNTLQKQYPNLKFIFKTIEKNFTARFILLDDDNHGLFTTVGIQTIKEGRFENPITAYGDITEMKPNFDFYGWSKNIDGEPILANVDNSINIWDASEDTLVKSGIFDYTFYAIFDIHKYIMTFIDGNGNTYIKKIPYGEVITAPTKAEFDPAKDYSDLADNEIYGFTGWALSENGAVVNLSKYNSTKNYTFYAIFKPIDVHKNVVYDYFDFSPYSYNDKYNSVFNISGYVVKPKTGITLTGKITIPASYNNAPVVRMTGFNKQKNLTHIFFEDGCKVRSINVSCFDECSKLKYFEFTKELRVIEDRAFRQCAIGTMLLPENLAEIGEWAFLSGLASSEPIEIAIGSEVVSIGGGAFNYCEKLAKKSFVTIGTPKKLSKLDLSKGLTQNGGVQRFAENSSYVDTYETIVFYTNSYSETDSIVISYFNSGTNGRNTLSIVNG